MEVKAPAQAVDSQEMNRLEKEVASLKKELKSVLDALKNGKFETAAAEAPARATPSRKSPNVFKPDIGRAQQIMREATKQELVTLQTHWKDVLDYLSVTQRAVLRQAEPVAANGQACILAFEYDILCQKATEDVELREDRKSVV